MTRRQSNNQWSGGIATHPAPNNSECKNPLLSSRLDFLRSRRHPPQINFQSASQTINAEYYSSLLVQLKNILKEKHRGKFTKVVLFSHDNALTQRALATQKKMAYLGFQFLVHPPYSPDMAPSDYHLFPELKKTKERSPFFVRRENHCCCGDLVGRTNF